MGSESLKSTWTSGDDSGVPVSQLARGGANVYFEEGGNGVIVPCGIVFLTKKGC